MIRIAILVDMDDVMRLRTDTPVEAQAPPGYVISELRCKHWSLNSRTGAVSLEVCFCVTTAPDRNRR